MLLEVKNLSVTIGGQCVIDGLDFNVEKRNSLAILGPNGSGKSTLLKAILGLIPYKGEVKWHGNPNISYLPERLSPLKFKEYPLTTREYFAFKKVDEKTAENALLSVGLDNAKEILKRNPGELSSGQFQRMLIAWSLADNPDVLLFDEPTVGIDVGGEETIYSLLHKIWKERELTIFLVTHEIEVVYAFSTHVLCVRKNHLCYGTPREVLTPDALEDLYGSPIKFYEHAQDHKHHHGSDS